MKILVLGSGLQGSACAFDLLSTTDASVTIADRAPGHLPAFLLPFRGRRLAVLSLDAREEEHVREAMRGQDVVLSALPYYFNVQMARMAIDTGAHFADLGGNTEIVRQQETMDAEAKAKNVSVVPDCGV